MRLFQTLRWDSLKTFETKCRTHFKRCSIFRRTLLGSTSHSLSPTANWICWLRRASAAWSFFSFSCSQPLPLPDCLIWKVEHSERIGSDLSLLYPNINLQCSFSLPAILLSSSSRKRRSDYVLISQCKHSWWFVKIMSNYQLWKWHWQHRVGFYWTMHQHN